MDLDFSCGYHESMQNVPKYDAELRDLASQLQYPFGIKQSIRPLYKAMEIFP